MISSGRMVKISVSWSVAIFPEMAKSFSSSGLSAARSNISPYAADVAEATFIPVRYKNPLPAFTCSIQIYYVSNRKCKWPYLLHTQCIVKFFIICSRGMHSCKGSTYPSIFNVCKIKRYAFRLISLMKIWLYLLTNFHKHAMFSPTRDGWL